MDQYGQIGPEKGNYGEDVRDVANALKFPERAVHVLLTHRMTQQSLVLCLKDAMELNGPVAGCSEGVWLFVARLEHGAYWFRYDHMLDASYVASKLDIHRVDAETLVDFIERIARELGVEPQVATSVVTQMMAGETGRLRAVVDGEVV